MTKPRFWRVFNLINRHYVLDLILCHDGHGQLLKLRTYIGSGMNEIITAGLQVCQKDVPLTLSFLSSIRHKMAASKAEL